MKLSIIFYFNKYSKSFTDSLKRLMAIDGSENIQLVLVNDCADEKCLNFIETLNFDKFNSLKLIYLSQVLGFSYCYNSVLHFCDGEYVFLMTQNVKINKNFYNRVFVEKEKEISNSNVISLMSKDFDIFDSKFIDTLKKEIYTKLDSDICFLTSGHLYNKIYERDFLLKNKITMPDHHFYPLVFLFTLLVNFTRYCRLDEHLITVDDSDVNFFVNPYDCIFQINFLLDCEVKKYDQDIFKKYKPIFEFWTIKAILISFVNIVMQNSFSEKKIETALNSGYQLLMKKFPNYVNNLYISKIVDKDWKKYFLKFKPKISFVKTYFPL